ncbi:hypothetical protein F66182_3231 [Fusarium sp. NRRL 66182]|nr:hypothetical protein F66182_3231 [Fusarium sp. NRRL 66182]
MDVIATHDELHHDNKATGGRAMAIRQGTSQHQTLPSQEKTRRREWSHRRPPRPTHFTIINPGDSPAKWPFLDSRLNQYNWLSAKPTRYVSREVLWDTLEGGYHWKEDKYHRVRLRHANAADCPMGEDCTHWGLSQEDGAARQEGTVELLLVCMTTEDAEKGTWKSKGPIFDDAITCRPSRLFHGMKPDFSTVKAAGSEVVLCHLAP